MFQSSGDSGRLRNSYLYDPRYQLGMTNLQQGADTSPVLSPWQGLARVLQSSIGAYQTQQAEEDFNAAEAERIKQTAAILRGVDRNDAGAGGSADPSAIYEQLLLVPGMGDAALEMWMEHAVAEPEQLVEVWDGEKMIRVPQSQAVGLQSQAPDVPDPFKPNIENIVNGNQYESGYLDQNNQWVSLGNAGPRFAPQQPQAAWTRVEDPTQFGFPAGSVVTQNSLTGDFQVEYSPGVADGGATPAQLANNGEIATARRYIESLGMDATALRSALTQEGALGGANPNYDPMVEEAWSVAAQRMVGEDPTYDSFMSRFYGGGSLVGDPGSDTSAAQQLPMSDSGVVDESKLQAGAIYITPQGVLRWNGSDFETVQ